MWLSSPIRASKYSYVERFDLIVAIAKAMRGNHFYYVSAPDRAIYGVPEEPYAIRRVFLPPEINVGQSFIFRLDTIDPDVVAHHLNFVLFEDLPWALIPAMNKDDIINCTPIFRPSSDVKLWTIVNTSGNIYREIEFIDLYGPDGKKAAPLPRVMDAIKAFFAAQSHVSQMAYVFPSMERHTVVQDVFSSKASMGERFLDLTFDDKSYGILLFKNLFSFNKNDALTIEARDRIDQPNLFQMEFKVTHDKSPIKYIVEGKFVESTFATFVHLI